MATKTTSFGFSFRISAEGVSTWFPGKQFREFFLSYSKQVTVVSCRATLPRDCVVQTNLTVQNERIKLRYYRAFGVSHRM